MRAHSLEAILLILIGKGLGQRHHAERQRTPAFYDIRGNEVLYATCPPGLRGIDQRQLR